MLLVYMNFQPRQATFIHDAVKEIEKSYMVICF